MEASWNIWHGCQKKSSGCLNCYVYRGDSKRGLNASKIYLTSNLNIPIRKKRDGTYKYPSGTLFWTCFTSDFLLEEADEWRIEAWKIIKERKDCHFFFITKRIDLLMQVIPLDWGSGYDNVTIGCTCENQEMLDYRLPIFKNLLIKHRIIILEPLLGEIDLSKYLDNSFEQVVAGGESGLEARICNFDWIIKIQQLCIEKNVKFWFKQTGTKFMKNNKLYNIPRKYQHHQARKANINYL